MRTLVPLFVGVVLGMMWIVLFSETPMYSLMAEEYGEESTGLCLGGPAFMIMMAGMIITRLMEERQ